MQITLKDFVTVIHSTILSENKKNVLAEADLISPKGIKLRGIVNTVSFSRPSRIPPKAGLYLIRLIPTGQFYVGSAENLGGRRATHYSLLKDNCHKNQNLSKAFVENNPKAFEFTYFLMTEEIDKKPARELLYELEQEVLDMYSGTEICFNSGRDAKYPSRGKTISDQHRQALSRAHKGKIVSEETRRKMSEAHIGKSRPIEAMRKTLAASLVSRERAVYLDGQAYRSATVAAEKLPLNYNTLVSRIKSTNPKWANWDYVDKLWDI